VSSLDGLTLAGPQNGRGAGTPAAALADRLAPWRRGVTVTPVSRPAARHTMHAYYTAVPEAPDGASVLLYASDTRKGYEGSVIAVDRATGAERVLVAGVSVEDTHRAACQQWVSGGRRVIFHDRRDGVWVVACVDLATGAQRVLARDRQLGWGQPDADVVPVYGPHWDPRAHRDLDLLDVASGQQRTVLKAQAVREAFPEAIAQEFGERPISIFFPALSPDLSRVLFKIATPLGGDFRSKEASHRALLVAYDLVAERLLFVDQRWGHPAWHPDSRTILDVPNVLIDSDTGARRSIPGLPLLPGAHPSFDASGDLVVADVALERLGGATGERGIVVEDIAAGQHVLVDRFDDTNGAASWRRNHPHPVFSADGQRLYYCVSATPWAQLCVASPRSL
jgi:hypothetical protein